MSTPSDWPLFRSGGAMLYFSLHHTTFGRAKRYGPPLTQARATGHDASPPRLCLTASRRLRYDGFRSALRTLRVHASHDAAIDHMIIIPDTLRADIYNVVSMLSNVGRVRCQRTFSTKLFHVLVNQRLVPRAKSFHETHLLLCLCGEAGNLFAGDDRLPGLRVHKVCEDGRPVATVRKLVLSNPDIK
jgi:hypothetical protein